METATDAYALDSQVGHLLRRANQRHTALFARRFTSFDLTPLQFAVLMKLREAGPLSQNLLGRQTAMDPNTVQGVILRLLRRRLIDRTSSPEDKRCKLLALTAAGQELAERLVEHGLAISEETLAPLNAAQRRQLLTLLTKLT